MKFPQAPQAIAKRVQIEKPVSAAHPEKKPPTTAPRFLAALKQLAPYDRYALAYRAGATDGTYRAGGGGTEKTQCPAISRGQCRSWSAREARREMRLVAETCRRVGLPHKVLRAECRWAQAAFSRRRANCAIG